MKLIQFSISVSDDISAEKTAEIIEQIVGAIFSVLDEAEEHDGLVYHKMEKLKYGWIKCQQCGKRRKLWVESECYKKKICPECINK